MNTHLPLYEDLYGVSDLHLGGTQGIRIFRSGEKLKMLVDHLANTTPTGGGSRALVLNGDIIDTLAEGIEHYVASPEEAEKILKRIVVHQDFHMVWGALANFVSKPKHRLVICIGNHDLELAYPNIQEQIVEILGGKIDEAIRGRILFSTAGTGHLCRVGNASTSARVLCIHGNEYDSWNAVNPEEMTRLVRSACLGAKSLIADEPPNAGTQLVIDVMNDIKRKFPFVDLLKPEMETVFNVLLALEPSLFKKLPEVLKLVTVAKTQGTFRVAHVLGLSEAKTGQEIAKPREWKPKGEFGNFLQHSTSSPALLDKAWELSASKDVTEEELPDEVLGVKEFVINSLRYLKNRITDDPREALRCALLDWVGEDQSWDLNGPDDVRDEIRRIAPDVDVVIAGHTHLRRQMEVSCQGADDSKRFFYLNTGTWASLMKLDKARLKDKEFEKFWESISRKSTAALSSLIQDQGTVGVVRLNKSATGVEAAICEQAEGAAELELVREDRDKPENQVKNAWWAEVVTHG